MALILLCLMERFLFFHCSASICSRLRSPALLIRLPAQEHFFPAAAKQDTRPHIHPVRGQGFP